MKPELLEVLVREIIKESPDAITLVTSREGLNYNAGQFVTIHTSQFAELANVRRGRKHGARAYSFASSPTEKNLAFTIKEEAGGKLSPWILQGGIKVGDKIKIRGPYGHFFYDYETHKDVVFIGAGSGIVPLRSIMKYIIDLRLPVQVKLFYSNKTKEDIIYKRELEEWNKLNNVEVIHNLTREGEKKHIDELHLSTYIIDFSKFSYFLCGPNSFCNSMREILLKKGVLAEKIKMEKYG